jgi:hypothetical protein
MARALRATYANVTTLAQRLDGVRAKVIELPKPSDAA